MIVLVDGHAEGEIEIMDNLVLFEGVISHNITQKPMVSNAYFLDDGDEAILFDPSCGKDIAKRIENHLQERRAANVKWRRAVVLAGHSHPDHANNFYLSDAIRAQDTKIYVHEKGFKNGIVANEPVQFFRGMIEESRRYYNPYLSFSGPNQARAMMLIDKVSANFFAKTMSSLGGRVWPPPINGSTRPEPLREEDIQTIDIGSVQLKGWRLGNKVVLPTPGHSPCSVSLFWPDRRAIFISDADWHGNPVFVSSSLKDCISSLEMIKTIIKAGKIDLYLPGHGEVIEGEEKILSHLDSCIEQLEKIRSEVLSAHESSQEKDVQRLTRILVDDYPLFGKLKQSQMPKDVVNIYAMVTVCLKEEGIIT